MSLLLHSIATSAASTTDASYSTLLSRGGVDCDVPSSIDFTDVNETLIFGEYSAGIDRHQGVATDMNETAATFDAELVRASSYQFDLEPSFVPTSATSTASPTPSTASTHAPRRSRPQSPALVAFQLLGKWQDRLRDFWASSRPETAPKYSTPQRPSTATAARPRSPALVAIQLLGKWKYMEGNWALVIGLALCAGLLSLASFAAHVVAALNERKAQKKLALIEAAEPGPVEHVAAPRPVTPVVEPAPVESEPINVAYDCEPSLETNRLAFYSELDDMPLEFSADVSEAEVGAVSEKAWERLCGVVGDGRTPGQVLDFAERELELLLMDPMLAALVNAETLECDDATDLQAALASGEFAISSLSEDEQEEDEGYISPFDASEIDGASHPPDYALPSRFLPPTPPESVDSDSDSSSAETSDSVEASSPIRASPPATPVRVTPPMKLKQRKFPVEGDESPNCIMAF